MKISFILCVSFLVSSVSAADFNDPMKPPAYALNKFRMEKLKHKQPVLPPKAVQQKQPPWNLSSILFSKQRQHAIINDRLVKQGDVIRGAKLVRLRPDSVRLLANGKTIDLSLREAITSLKKSPVEKKYEQFK